MTAQPGRCGCRYGTLAALLLSLVLCGPAGPACAPGGSPPGAADSLAADLYLSEPAAAAPARDGDAQELRAVVDAWLARPRAPDGCRDVVIDYPEDGTVFPPDLATPPTFLWHAPGRAIPGWLLTISLAAPGRQVHVRTDGTRWRPSPELWRVLRSAARHGPATWRVLEEGAAAGAAPLASCTARFSTSPDPVGAPIFYRDVPLPFMKALRDMRAIRWRLGDVSRDEEPRILLEGMPVCANCHSFSREGGLIAMDIDYANDKGSYFVGKLAREVEIRSQDVFTWGDFARDVPEPTFGLLSQISPDGRHAVSTVKDRSLFVPRSDEYFSQLFFPAKGILVVYSLEQKRFWALPGADDRRFVQSNPSWSPDGSELIFARAPVQQAVLERIGDSQDAVLTEKDAAEFLDPRYAIRYDLYRIPFAEGRGGTPVPVEGASGNGLSNYFARYSPDGRWLVFTRSPSGMLLQPGSELYIVPAGGGTPRRMRCNVPHMNSWHSWSPNGRWLVFAGKGRSPHTQLYLTHVDEAGNDTPAVLLERFFVEGRAANIPEFYPAGVEQIQALRERFLDDGYYLELGVEAYLAGRLDQAAAELLKSLALNGRSAAAYQYLGLVRQKQGKLQDSIAALEHSLELNPYDRDTHTNLGISYGLVRAYRDAEQELRQAERLGAQSCDVFYNLARVIAAQGRERLAESSEYYRRCLAVQPGSLESHAGLWQNALALGDLAGAEAALRAILQLEPGEAMAHYHLAQLCERTGRLAEAAAELRLTLESSRGNAQLRQVAAAELARIGGGTPAAR